MSGLAGPVIDFGLLVIGAMLLGGLAIILRQPVILAYIAAGVLLGSTGLGLIHDEQYLYEIASELGIAMLLFVVGLELSIKKMLEVRKVVTFGVIAQSLIFVILGMFIGHIVGFELIEGIYLGLAIAFASTLLIVKGLGEKHAIDSLPGRIMVGSLVFEDILVIVVISILGMLAGQEPTGFVQWFIDLPGLNLIPYIQNIALIVGAGLLILLAYLLNKYVARAIFHFYDRSTELLFVASLGFLFIVAFIAGELGFSVAIGAFLAGVIVANTEYYLDVLSKVKTLATFFALLFFATLGFKVTFANFHALLLPIILITLAVLVIKPIIVGLMVRLFGYDKHTAIYTGLHMSQISEFSLILLTFGIKFGHVRPELLTIAIIVLLLSFVGSSYYMQYATQITSFLQRRFKSLQSDHIPEVAIKHASAVIYGVEHIDEQFITDITAKYPDAVFVDPDPESVAYVREKGFPVIVGSLNNEEVAEQFPSEGVQLVISTIPNFEENLLIAEHARKHMPKATVMLAASRIKDALTLYELGATYVHVASFIDDTNVQALLHGDMQEKLLLKRQHHIERLAKIAARRHGAVDIEDFMAALAEQHLSAGREAFQRTTKPVFDEIDKVMKRLGKK